MRNSTLEYEVSFLRLKSSITYSCILVPALAATCMPSVLFATETPKFNSFDASILVIENLKRDVILSVAETSEVVIEELPGSGVKIPKTHDQLTISGSDSISSTQGINVSVVAVNGSAYFSTSVGGINAGAENLLSPLKILVPAYLELWIKRHSGTVSTEGPIGFIDYQGSGKLDVESVRHFTSSLSGNARVNVGEIFGDLNVSGTGNSKIIIHDGLVEAATVNLKGNAKVEFLGGADVLSLNAKGNAKFEIGSVRYLDEVLVKGNARVKILESKQIFTSKVK